MLRHGCACSNGLIPRPHRRSNAANETTPPLYCISFSECQRPHRKRNGLKFGSALVSLLVLAIYEQRQSLTVRWSGSSACCIKIVHQYIRKIFNMNIVIVWPIPVRIYHYVCTYPRLRSFLPGVHCGATVRWPTATDKAAQTMFVHSRHRHLPDPGLHYIHWMNIACPPCIYTCMYYSQTSLRKWTRIWRAIFSHLGEELWT